MHHDTALDTSEVRHLIAIADPPSSAPTPSPPSAPTPSPPSPHMPSPPSPGSEPSRPSPGSGDSKTPTPETTTTTPTTTTTTTATDKTSEPQVILYNDSQYRGDSQHLGVGRYSWGEISNDTISSLRIPVGMKVTAFADTRFTGDSRTYTEDIPWVGHDFNDKISSIIVEMIEETQ